MTPSERPSWPGDYAFSSQFVQLDGGHRMHYVDEGEGEPLVFVHGNPTWSFYWRHLLAGLRDRYRVIACDHLGCGLSDKPQHYDFCLARHSHNLSRLLEHLNVRRMTMVGHDWGGAIGLHCGLVDSPGRLERVILFNTAAFPPHRIPFRIAICRARLLGPLLIRGLNAFPRAALHMAVSRGHQWSAAERRAILAPYGNWHDRVGIWRFVRDIPSTTRHPTFQVLQHLQDQLANLHSVPVKIIWGMQDWCFDPSCLQRLISHIPHADVTCLPDAGHWVVEDAPQAALDSVHEFLQCQLDPSVNQQA